MAKHVTGPAHGSTGTATRADAGADTRGRTRPVTGGAGHRSRTGRWSGRIAIALSAVITVAGGVVLFGPDDALRAIPWAAAPDCTPQPVDLVVSPELRDVVTRIVRPVQGASLQGYSGQCTQVKVRAQEPRETAASAGILPISRAPQIWIPDASSWAGVASGWPTSSAGSLASTPVVLATSQAAAHELGWDRKNPTWRWALRGARPVAVPDYQEQSESLEALIALWQTLGKNPRAEKQVVATVLAADRQEVPSPSAALADAQSGAREAPLIPSTEQAVAALNAASVTKHLVAVYPQEGSPRLDYPILTVGGTAGTPAAQQAVTAVTRQLRSERARELLRADGFRDTQGGAPTGTGIRPDYGRELPRPGSDQVEGMLRRIDNLAKPSRILAVYDVSGSMSARLDDGLTRIALAGAASRIGVQLLPDSCYLGVWIFATGLGGDRDYRELAPVRQLGARADSGETNRSALSRIAANFSSYLSTSGGTALYDSTDAAFARMHADYDPRAINAIILLSDGSNDDPGSISLNRLLARLRAGNARREQVKIFTGALGRDADSAALQKIAAASGGRFYTINDAADGQRALLDGLRRSRNIGYDDPPATATP